MDQQRPWVTGGHETPIRFAFDGEVAGVERDERVGVASQSKERFIEPLHPVLRIGWVSRRKGLPARPHGSSKRRCSWALTAYVTDHVTERAVREPDGVEEVAAQLQPLVTGQVAGCDSHADRWNRLRNQRILEDVEQQRTRQRGLDDAFPATSFERRSAVATNQQMAMTVSRAVKPAPSKSSWVAPSPNATAMAAAPTINVSTEEPSAHVIEDRDKENAERLLRRPGKGWVCNT